MRSAVDPAATPRSRSARHRATGDTGSWSTVRTEKGPQRSAGSRRSRAKRPVVGSHRAPNTLPLESWLAAAKNRPTTVLGTLVVAGLLITVVPLSQPDSSDPGQLTTAAQAAASAQAAERNKAAQAGGRQQSDGGAKPQGQPVTGGSATPTPEATVTGRPAEDNPARPVPAGAGPGKSLLTTGGRQVALTFDDGPDPVLTPKILAMLGKYQVKATFCLVGSQARKHPELVRQIVAAGHTLCNHTFDHDLTIGKKNAGQIRADLARTNQAIRDAAPGAAIPFFRAPGGNFSDKLVKVAYADGMSSLYWAVDPRDWEHPAGESDAAHIKRVISSVRKQTTPGAIILSHDFNQPDTIAAYQELLPWLVKNFQLGIPSGTGETPVTPATTAPTPATPTPSASATTAPVTPTTTPSASPSSTP
ncbi:peptidoglycan/xylan/chitin deacetylase (PgdA/CDA1 family) [Actinoplanes octamycinicus]|uniref:Peptidoglycan/xylan/chitin deacetylase (PgdA/CDA1 family) n=1 Tax=Actinoplanes octamycinicus TaxID=135948 RepID=A0A7W7GS11_9ACTN|nr:polysaccharide deacetylase family protein [Actinoplanes octamycinicus]MBB4737241.1 peptidoglycan/xylan/chitin deacetylase (PgdA/CDA1 family) [Actinoplanes octamycinicus]